jgi:hypothetical protein
MKEKLTQKELKRQLYYDPKTGIFKRRVSNNNKVKIGDITGSLRLGYVRIKINYIDYAAHRLVWLYVYGYFPENDIDHIDGVRDNNILENLRHVTASCNMQNKTIDRRNTSGFPGISWAKRHKMWSAYMKIRGKTYFIGYYKDKLDAALARYTAEVNCPYWTCDHRGELTKAIRSFWPSFKGA